MGVISPWFVCTEFSRSPFLLLNGENVTFLWYRQGIISISFYLLFPGRKEEVREPFLYLIFFLSAFT